jgi:uncharacterized repeat protein (TIGR01451 family)
LIAQIYGHLFIDTNGNGISEMDEPTLSNVDVKITDANGATQIVVTDADGNWTASVPPGSTTVDVQESDPQYPAGYTQTAGTDPSTVLAVSGVSTDAGVDGYYLPGPISGHLFIDTNGNGTQDQGEPNLANVDVKITDANGTFQIVSTDASGNWATTVPPGLTTVDVQESDPQYPTGYAQTAGTDPSTVVAVAGVSTNGGIDGYAPITDLAVVKTVNVTTPVVGANLTFTITATNNGPAAATEVIVNDVLQSGYTFVSATPSTGTWTAPNWTIGNLANGSSATLTIIATVKATGSYVNTAVISGKEPDPIPGNNTSTVSPGPTPTADLAILKTVNNPTPNVGANVTFTITATNNGPSAATGVTVSDPLPAGYTLVSATPSTGSWTAPNWTIGNFANGGNATLTIVATVKAVGPYANTATITGNETDPTPGNNTSTSTPVPVASADLAVLKTVNNPAPSVGSNVIFTITATNNGPSAATGVSVNDPLPAGYTLVSAIPSTGSWTAPNWTIGNLANGGNATLTIVATVKAVGPYANTAIITGNETDPNLSNNSSTVIPVVSSSTDISVTKTVYNAVPPIGGTSVFTISVTNNSPSTGATNVVISDVLHANLVFQSYTASAGIYDLGTGAWTLASLAPAATATLTITVKVQGSADNTASLTSLDQVDTNPANNQSTVSVTVSGSSGGNGGGLESNGDLAGLIALRNFNRVKESTKAAFESPATMMNFTDDQVKAGLIQPASTLKGTTGLINYLPESGPFRSKAYVSTPSDLLEISNAREVVAVDYFNESSQRYGAILALTTDQGEVYNHTKLICDRLTGARLENSMNIEIGGKPFILTKLVQENGDIDYAVTFVTWTSGTGMTIDSRWHNEEYKPAAGSTVFNFQIWSVTIQSTVEMVQEVLARIESDKKVTYLNTKARNIPVVQVVAGTYSNGAISLELNNPAGAASVTVKGTFTRTELSDKESFQTTLTLDPARVHQTIEVPVGTIYDAGFSVANPIDATRDALYFADGSWGLDFPEAGAVVTSYTLDPEPVKVAEGELALERNVTFKGQVRDYVSIFRGIRAGSRPVDLSGYNALRFEASGTGAIEVVVTKASVQGWSQQFRTQIFLEPSLQSYDIEFEKMISGSGFTGLNAGDVESVVFSMIGNGSEWRSSEMELKNLKLINKEPGMGALSLEDFRLGNYPNPLTTQTQIQFELPEKGKVTLSILDATGREIEVLASREFDKGKNYITWNASTVEAGIYLLRMKYNDMQAVKRMIVE